MAPQTYLVAAIFYKATSFYTLSVIIHQQMIQLCAGRRRATRRKFPS